MKLMNEVGFVVNHSRDSRTSTVEPTSLPVSRLNVLTTTASQT